MFNAGNKRKRDGHGLHLILVCDEAGIFDAFNFLMDRFSDPGNSFISLIKNSDSMPATFGAVWARVRLFPGPALCNS